MNIDDLVAIDMHTHVWRSVTMPAGAEPDEMKAALGHYFCAPVRSSGA